MGRQPDFTLKTVLVNIGKLKRTEDTPLFQHILVYPASLAEPRCLEVGIMGAINELKANSQILKQARTASQGLV